ADRRLRDRERWPQPGRQPPDPLPGRDLPGPRVLDVRGRAQADRRPDAHRMRCRRRVPVPVRRVDRLHDRPPAGVPRRRARARARDAGGRGPDERGRLPPLPALRLRGAVRVPALSQLHAQAQGPVHQLRQAARPRLEALPVLRGRDPRRHPGTTQPPQTQVGGDGSVRAVRRRASAV
ncbi:MAG: hypothetical protein AVDCRST_MAG85-2302, partial [uncultured Solirubrobacteraceae bacterium]